jgi:hypothetical protein
MNYLRRHWFWILLAIAVAAGFTAFCWFFPSGESQTAKSQAVSGFLSFLVAAIVAAMTWFYVQTTREMLAEMRAESFLREPQIEVTLRMARHESFPALDGYVHLDVSVWLHIQNLSRASFSVTFLDARIDNVSAKLTGGEFIVGETRVQIQTSHLTRYLTPKEKYVYLEEGGAFDGKLSFDFTVNAPEGSRPITELSGWISFGFPRGQRREIAFLSGAGQP